MPSIKDLKKRITSVKNTQQTTRAMKMVSAAKLRRAQEAILCQRPYARSVDRLIRKVVKLPAVKANAQSPLLDGFNPDNGTGSGTEKILLVLVTSDRGLCGAYNGNVIKAAQRWLLSNREKYSQISLGFVGRKAFDFFKTKSISMGPNYVDFSGKVSFLKAKGLSDKLIELFLSGEYQEIKFIYNEFKNAVSQQVLVEDFLPLNSSEVNHESSVSTPAEEEAFDYIVKPNALDLFDSLLKKHFSAQSFRVLLEAQASEHGARMSSMENATNNAADMIKQLTLQYNKQRQAGITKELLEIIAGSESQKTT